MEGISVIICCYNSAERISKTLDHLLAQKTSEHIPWEIILVDNNSTDDTTIIADKYHSSFNKLAIPFRIIPEQQQGLSHARKKGYKEAQFDFLLYCDDDNWLDNHYIQIAYEQMSSDKKIGVIGGTGIAECEIKKPQWFDPISPYYAVGNQEGQYTVYGAGMIIRKSGWTKMEELGFNLILKDREGKLASSGGDTEIQLVYKILGYSILHNDSLKFKHFIPKERLTKKYFQNIVKGCGESLDIISAYQHHIDKKPSGLFPLFLLIAKSIATLPFLGIKYILSNDLSKSHIKQRFIYTKRIITNPQKYLMARKKIKTLKPIL